MTFSALISFMSPMQTNFVVTDLHGNETRTSNDYLVFEEGEAWLASEAAVARVCHRTRGEGSDGIVVLCTDPGPAAARLRMFNPDGSEFERSGNGLRILASYLAREGRVGPEPFRVDVGGGSVEMTVQAIV